MLPDAQKKGVAVEPLSSPRHGKPDSACSTTFPSIDEIQVAIDQLTFRPKSRILIQSNAAAANAPNAPSLATHPLVRS
jgi:hypothetical protein